MIQVELLNYDGITVYTIPIIDKDALFSFPAAFLPGGSIRVRSDELPARGDCQRCAELEARLDAIKSAGRWDADEDLS